MLVLIMLIWIGRTLLAPTWYWWCCAILGAMMIVKFLVAIYNLGKGGK